MSDLPLDPPDEPTNDAPDEAPDDAGASGPEDSIPLEPHDDDDAALAREPCPNCGASIPAGDSICVRCGFDVMDEPSRAGASDPAPTFAAAMTVDGSDDDDDGDDADLPPEIAPLVRPDRGGVQAPLLVAGGCLVVMAVAYLAGARGLFHLGEEATIPALGLRLADLARWVAMVLTATVAGLGAIVVSASLDARPVGNAAVGTARLLALTALAGLAVLLDLGPWGLERFAELALQIAGFTLLAGVWFRWSMKFAVRFVAVTALIQLMVVALAAFVAWAWLGSP